FFGYLELGYVELIHCGLIGIQLTVHPHIGGFTNPACQYARLESPAYPYCMVFHNSHHNCRGNPRGCQQ
ncbi:MAG: hypothetical protein L0Y68_10055, partial [Candidatus Dadabacteria bacterium]|nr:hypothetical protein [Candidatus Dadabacteria bacterium]